MSTEELSSPSSFKYQSGEGGRGEVGRQEEVHFVPLPYPRPRIKSSLIAKTGEEKTRRDSRVFFFFLKSCERIPMNKKVSLCNL